MRLQLNDSSPYFLFLSIRRLGWRCCVLFGRAIYLVNRNEWTLPCGQPGTGNMSGKKSSTSLSQQCLTEVFILLSPAELSVQFLQTERLLLSPGSPGRRARANSRTCPSSTPGSFNFLTAIFHLANFRTSLHERDGASRGRWLWHYFRLIYYFLEISLKGPGTEWEKEVPVSPKWHHCAFM